MPEIRVPITDELASELLNKRVDAVGVCLTALTQAITEHNMTQENQADPAKAGPGRPKGLSRIKRSINLEPRIWDWLATQQRDGESFNDTCNRILAALLPAQG